MSSHIRKLRRGVVASRQGAAGPGGPVIPPPPPPPPPPPTSTNNITWTTRSDVPFKVPSKKDMRNSKIYLSHYFLTFPIALTTSQDSPTAPDVSTLHSPLGVPVSASNQWGRWNPPSYGLYAGYGGIARDYPEYMRGPRTAVESPTKPGLMLDYRVLDKITEIRQAMSAGMDGFTPDWLDVPRNTAEYNLTVSSTAGGAPLMWRKLVELYEAAAEVVRQEGAGSFYLVPMPDGSTQATLTSATLADAIIHLDKKYPGVHYYRNGKLVLAPYYPEKAPDKSGTPTVALAFWKDVIARLKVAGIETYFLPCYQNTWNVSPQQPVFQPISDGISRWGDRSPAQSKGETSQNRQMYKVILRDFPGNEFMAPVSFQDFRPNQSNYFENDHESQLWESWITAIGDINGPDDPDHIPADLVQVPTWNDYAEGAYIAPTVNHGYCWLDMSLYSAIRWKVGVYPEIDKDALYLSHRVQPTDSVATMNYTGYTVSTVNVSGRAPSGTFTLTRGGGTTPAITYSSTRSTMQANLQAGIRTLPGMSAATVGQNDMSSSKYYVKHPGSINPLSFGGTATGNVTWKVEQMVKRSDGMTDQNTVGVTCYFKSGGNTVTVNIGGRTSIHTNVPAGRQVLRDPLLPIGTGLISVTATRGGVEIARVNSSEYRKVETTKLVQDRAYYAAKSLPDPVIKAVA